MNIAIIPARGGSKRIPGKNIKEFCGKPMIAWSIEVAKASGLFDHIIVSTDDKEISSIANVWGAETPFVRPDELANDFTGTVPVIKHGIQECRFLGWHFDYVCCIYPCAPFLQIEDLQGAFTLLSKSDSDYSFPVTEFPSSIQRALKRKDGGKMEPFYPEYEPTRTQDLEIAYHDAGQFYWGKANSWLDNPKIHSNAVGYVIPNWRSVDIDTPEDWLRAEVIYKLFQD